MRTIGDAGAPLTVLVANPHAIDGTLATLDAFSVRLRDEVDLDSVRAELVDAVQRTVQPAHASIWLRPE